jgi:hypothetical protein
VKKKETIDIRLDRLGREFDELLGNHQLINNDEDRTAKIKRLLHFGLTKEEARGWLKSEPNYKPTDESLHRKRTDGDLTEPSFGMAAAIFNQL